MDGEDRGTTPRTLQIRRAFGESTVSIRVGNEVVRRYEFERASSSNQSDLVYSFRGDNNDGMQTYDLTDLSQRGNRVYVVPYFEHPIRVEDRQYGLTLEVSN